ncbi:MAG: hypothetical protein ACFCUM_09665 [Bacteroidales bacterium]
MNYKNITVILLISFTLLNSCGFDAYNVVTETDEKIEISHVNYKISIEKEGFKYSFQKSDGTVIADKHPVSGLRFTEAGGSELIDALFTDLLAHNNDHVSMLVTTSGGDQANVIIDLFENYVKFSIIPYANELTANDEGESANSGTNNQKAFYIIDARTASLDPVYGLGDYGSHANEFNDVDAPCGFHVTARDAANVMGLVRDEITNQGSCRRFISNFAIFPAHGFAQVLFDDGKKRVGFTEDENRIGVADVEKVNTLYYFIGDDMEKIYADYKNVRTEEGYLDVKPRYTMFNVGWEAYGALGWNTYQSSVMENIETYLDKGFPLKWGVVGSGFWIGARSSGNEGTTVSFGMWDNTPTPRNDGLPNPRYPDPEALKKLFSENEISLLIGIRNHFKDPTSERYNEQNDGLFPVEALEKNYLLRNREGMLVRSTNNSFPGGPIFFLDSFNEQAMKWFKENFDLWGVDGLKEDAMIYDKHYQDAMWNPFNKYLSDNDYLVIVRNAAYSVPGDLIRINDSYAGAGEHYHADPHRIPLNLLNNAASGAANGYPDIIGGTPVTGTTNDTFRKYYVRNVILAAVTPGMSFGRGPWLMEHQEYEEIALKAALWHDKYAPYIYSAAIDSYNSGYPHTMTPLHIAFPKDENTYNLISRDKKQYHWMLGPSMLATPLFGTDFETAVSRDVYLPEGKWIDYETGKVFYGPTTLEAYNFPENKIPVFIGGKGVVVSKVSQKSENLNAEIFPIAKDGSSYTFTYIDGETTSTITNNNYGWNPETMVINDTTTGEMVDFDYNDTSGSFKFALTPENNYELTGGE